MLITADHDCAPDCPVCVLEADLSKFVKERKIVPRPTPINFATLFLYIPCAILAIAATFLGASAIFGRDHQSDVAGPSGDPSSIGFAESFGDEYSIRLTERLDSIERLLKDVHVQLDESVNDMVICDSASRIDDPNPGPSPRDNLESPRPVSSIQKKPDASAGNDYVLYLITACLLVTWLAVRGYLFWTDPGNFGLDFGWGSHDDYSSQDSRFWNDSDYFGGDSSDWIDPGGDFGCGTDGHDSGQDSARGLLGSLTSVEFNKAITEGIRNVGSEDAQSEEVDYASMLNEESRAATMVQARYRGHLVRMSRPLVQLREIARIGKNLNRLKELAEDGGFIDFLRMQGSIGMLAVEDETLKLLLQLDNIQGSHPHVSQILRSVAREIVFVQDRFDALLL